MSCPECLTAVSKGVSCPSLYYHFLCCHPAGSWHSSGFKRTQSSGNDAADKRRDAPGRITLKLDKCREEKL